MAYFEFEDNKVFYKIIGQGEPVLFLHGNTVSSKMFNSLKKSTQ
jgi:pimeloyl-ACP methyl ester carboxylesterase